MILDYHYSIQHIFASMKRHVNSFSLLDSISKHLSRLLPEKIHMSMFNICIKQVLLYLQ